MTETVQETTSRTAPYVVLQQEGLVEIVTNLLKSADVGLQSDEWERIRSASTGTAGLVYVEVERVVSRNGAHALTQVGRKYPTGATPPLVAVSERMFRPRTVTVEHDPRVRLS